MPRRWKIGIEWAKAQLEDLLNHDVPSVHFYIMQSSKAIKRLMKDVAL